MAKLKAHGQELLRIERQYKLHEGTPEETLYRETRSYRTDGHIMSKRAFWQTGSPYQADSWSDWGWKLFQKLKPGVSMPEHITKIRANVAAIEAKGWKIQTI